MRYISYHSNLLLSKVDGLKKYKFKNGVLIVGTATGTTAPNIIDVTDLMCPWTTDLNGATTNVIEMVGQGSLNGLDDLGASLTNLSDGYGRAFYKAPPIASGQSVPATAGIWYRVLTGQTIYNSVTYNAGDEFETDGSATTTSGTGTFALTLPPKGCEAFRTCQFRINTLQHGDESTDYWDFDEPYVPMDDNDCDSTEFYGFTIVG